MEEKVESQSGKVWKELHSLHTRAVVDAWQQQLWVSLKKSHSQPDGHCFWSSVRLCMWSRMVLMITGKHSGSFHWAQVKKNLLKISLNYDWEQRLVNRISHYFYIVIYENIMFKQILMTIDRFYLIEVSKWWKAYWKEFMPRGTCEIFLEMVILIKMSKHECISFIKELFIFFDLLF